MSQLAREYPDATDEELYTIGLRTPIKNYFKEGEPRYRYECRSCGDEMWLNQADHDTREMNKLLGRGFTIPKCGRCWE
jgi:hypothetical protein